MTPTPELQGLSPEKLAEIRALTERSYRGSDLKIVMKMLANLPATTRQLDAAKEVGDMLDNLAAQAEFVPALLAEVERLSGEYRTLDSNYKTAQANWDLTLDRAEAAESSVSRLTERAETAERERDKARDERNSALITFQSEERIVDRVWKALGISAYEEADGKAIDEIVADWKARALAAEALFTTREHGRDAAEVARELVDDYLTRGRLLSELRVAITAAILSERAEAEKMRKALEPFARCPYGNPDNGLSDNQGICNGITVGDLRRATRALASPPDDGPVEKGKETHIVDDNGNTGWIIP